MADRYDLNDAAVIQNPFPLLAEMRRDAPVHWNHAVKGWFVTRYHDVRMVMRDPRFSVEKMAPFAGHANPSIQHKIGFLADVLGGWMVFMDPPGHTRLREVLQSAFMPRTLAQLRPRVVAVANDLLDAVGGRTQIDLIAEYAYPLPATVIGDLCGVPREKTGQFKSWANDIGAFVLQGRDAPDKHTRTTRALRECVDYYHELVAEHRRHPRENLTGRLIDGGDSGHRLSDDEIVSTLILLLFAGHETTTNLIANGMLALLRQPDQMALLEANRELLDVLETRVGRVVINGFPTGVEVCHAMVHGGPFPATSDGRSTSVGTNAIHRFTRSVCYQGFPDALLPAELRKANPLGIRRLVDGKST